MKKVVTILALIAIIGLSSCKQDFVCQCMENGTVTKTPINSSTFLHAEHTCHSIGSTCSLITEER